MCCGRKSCSNNLVLRRRLINSTRDSKPKPLQDPTLPAEIAASVNHDAEDTRSPDAQKENAPEVMAENEAATTTLDQSTSAVDVTPETTKADLEPATEFYISPTAVKISTAIATSSTMLPNMIKPTAKSTLKPQAC
jgi:hypothetical protein